MMGHKCVCFFIGYACVSILGTGLSLQQDEDAVTNSILYLNGNVYTVDTSTRWDLNPHQAVVVENDKIAFVGSNKGAESYFKSGVSRVFNLHQSAVFPGFHDVHVHPLEAKSPVAGACELPALTRPDSDSFDDELSVCPQYRFGTEWVLGFGYSITPMLEYVREDPNNSPRELLDDYVLDRPAAMLEETSHSAWVNSRALEMAGINSSTPDRPGGVIMREPGSDEPNGILFENEAISIFALAMDPSSNQKMLDYNYEGLLAALNDLSAYGITSVCDARVFWKVKHDLAWKEACDNSNLTVRAILGLWAYPEEDDSNQIQTLKSLYTNSSTNCSLAKSQIKLYMDGIIQSTTAAMEDKYLLNLSLPVVSKENVGLNYFDGPRLEKYLRELQDFGDGNGFDFHIHAIGDRGIREALDAIERAQNSTPSRTPRHRITHVETLDPSDVHRFRQLGVIADFQVAGNFTLPSEHDELARFIGEEKAAFSIPVKSVVDTGAKATFSSDWDVSSLNPFIGLQHAIQRGNQSVSIKTAIEMYTANPAYAMRQEDRVGTLKVGVDADIVVIDRDILNVANSTIWSTVVLQTLFKGEIIYSREGSVVEDISSTFKPDSTGSGHVVAVNQFLYVVVLLLSFRVVCDL